MNYKIFMNFVKILKLIWIFKMIVKKFISITRYTHKLQIFVLYVQNIIGNIMMDENHPLI
jgi:hypothetical protein